MGTVYLIHFPRPYRHAKHYLGWTERELDARLEEHVKGQGSPLVYAMCQQEGITTVERLRELVARTWEADRHTERSIKNRGGKSKSCPVCQATERRAAA
jgi:hypothetical protein